MADEHFHEIQFSGKQLVFLFMATAVVAVVIFLTGVMVGRGARAAVENTAAGGVLEGPADSGPAPLVPASSPTRSPPRAGRQPPAARRRPPRRNSATTRNSRVRRRKLPPLLGPR